MEADIEASFLVDFFHERFHMVSSTIYVIPPYIRLCEVTVPYLPLPVSDTPLFRPNIPHRNNHNG